MSLETVRASKREIFTATRAFLPAAVSAVQPDGPAAGGGDLAATAGCYQTNSQP